MTLVYLTAETSSLVTEECALQAHIDFYSACSLEEGVGWEGGGGRRGGRRRAVQKNRRLLCYNVNKADSSRQNNNNKKKHTGYMVAV